MRCVAAPSALVLFAAFAACQVPKGAAPPPAVGSEDGDLFATVNSVRIRAADVLLKMGPIRGHQGTVDGKHVLEGIIQQELLAQEAQRLGLTLDPQVVGRLHQLEAEQAALKRKALADLYFQKRLAPQLQVPDQDVQAEFAANAERVRTEFRFVQVMTRNRAAIEQVVSQIKAGKTLEDVAAEQAGAGAQQLPHKPWDTGYLNWMTLPQAWRDVAATLQPGQTSGVIEGPNNRFWVVHLVEKRVNTEITAESLKTVLTEKLRGKRMEEARERAIQEARSRAKVVYVQPPELVLAPDPHENLPEP